MDRGDTTKIPHDIQQPTPVGDQASSVKDLGRRRAFSRNLTRGFVGVILSYQKSGTKVRLALGGFPTTLSWSPAQEDLGSYLKTSELTLDRIEKRSQGRKPQAVWKVPPRGVERKHDAESSNSGRNLPLFFPPLRLFGHLTVHRC